MVIRALLCALFFSLPLWAEQPRSKNDVIFQSTLLHIAQLFPNDKPRLVGHKHEMINALTTLYMDESLEAQTHTTLLALILEVVDKVHEVHNRLFTFSKTQEVVSRKTIIMAEQEIFTLLPRLLHKPTHKTCITKFFSEFNHALLLVTMPFGWSRWRNYIPMIATLLIVGIAVYRAYYGQNEVQKSLEYALSKGLNLTGACFERIGLFVSGKQSSQDSKTHKKTEP